METSYTPVDINKIQKKGTGLNTVLLLIVTFTALVLAIMLFMLIQKKLSQKEIQVEPTPVVVPSLIPTPTVMPPEEELVVPSVATESLTVTETITPESELESQTEPEPTIVNSE